MYSAGRGNFTGTVCTISNPGKGNACKRAFAGKYHSDSALKKGGILCYTRF